MDAWTLGVSQIVTLVLQAACVLAAIGLLTHTIYIVVAGIAGGSGRVVADTFWHIVGMFVAVALTIGAPRIVGDIIAALSGTTLFG